MNSSSLSAEQSQYFNSLSSQNSTQQQQVSNLVSSYQPNASVQYTSSPYASNNNYAEQVVAGQQQVQSVANRNSKRARVPPPSKIPSSAVEMPDTLSNIGYLDVQFGALDFGTEESFDTMSEKFQAASIVDNTQNVTAADVAVDYQTKSGVPQSAAAVSQLVSNADSLSGQNDNLSSTAYQQRQANSVVPPQTASSANTLSNASAGMFFSTFTLSLYAIFSSLFTHSGHFCSFQLSNNLQSLNITLTQRPSMPLQCLAMATVETIRHTPINRPPLCISRRALHRRCTAVQTMPTRKRRTTRIIRRPPIRTVHTIRHR